MKQIVLKPEIKEGEEFYFNGELVVAQRLPGALQFQFIKKNGDLLSSTRAGDSCAHVVTLKQEYYIIESPDEQDECTNCKTLNERCERLEKKLTKYQEFVCASTGQVADAGKVTQADTISKLPPINREQLFQRWEILKDSIKIGDIFEKTLIEKTLENLQPEHVFKPEENAHHTQSLVSDSLKNLIEHRDKDFKLFLTECSDVRIREIMAIINNEASKRKIIEKVQPEQEKKPEGNPFKVGEKVKTLIVQPDEFKEIFINYWNKRKFCFDREI